MAAKQRGCGARTLQHPASACCGSGRYRREQRLMFWLVGDASTAAGIVNDQNVMDVVRTNYAGDACAVMASTSMPSWSEWSSSGPGPWADGTGTMHRSCEKPAAALSRSER
eukprot:CAMPEP_0181400052 /NCGR_PEP_ID=MMETSP1110-20121109/1915_1 /TAXON_ID=174948 /ORGANISM="Symbiodinium sp., Strain CCMP421" /LENGTH=110 /DNA_ID=CAMNT_0023522137 /DNA_START=31 /DNA_END=362 /DNA_ORIENTATION=-